MTCLPDGLASFEASEASERAANGWFEDNDPGGVAFEYEAME